MEYLNGHDYSLLLTATDDGALRIWKNFADQRNPEMVTAWQGLSDMLPTTRGLARRVSISLDRSKGQGGQSWYRVFLPVVMYKTDMKGDKLCRDNSLVLTVSFHTQV
uniref:Uncharacterized protein n=1 Tax=Hucho hucho TaxID=62062 RepID=A0A4W5N6E9_9TELE